MPQWQCGLLDSDTLVPGSPLISERVSHWDCEKERRNRTLKTMHCVQLYQLVCYCNDYGMMQ